MDFLLGFIFTCGVIYAGVYLLDWIEGIVDKIRGEK